MINIIYGAVDRAIDTIAIETVTHMIVVELKHTWLGLSEKCSCCRVEAHMAGTGRDVQLL